MRGPKPFCEIKFVVVKVDRDDRIRSQMRCGSDRGQTHTSNADYRDAIATLHVCGVQHRAGASNHGTPDDAVTFAVDVVWDLHHIHFIGNCVRSPSENVDGRRSAAVRQIEANGSSLTSSLSLVFRHPRHHDRVAWG